MPLSRRSFLAAVMGAVAAPVVVRVLPPVKSEVFAFPKPLDVLMQDLGFFYQHYFVWESVVVRPGEVLNERLLPPPVPDDFRIDRIGAFYNADAPVGSLVDVVRSVRFVLRNGASDLIAAPLYVLPPAESHAPLSLAVPYIAKQGDDLGIYLDSNDLPVGSRERVTVGVVLQGVVRISGRG